MADFQNQNQGESDYEIFTPEPPKPSPWRKIWQSLTGLGDSSRFSRRSLYVIATALVIFVCLFAAVKVFYKPEYAGPASGVNLSPVLVENTAVVARTDDSGVAVVYLRNPNKAYGLSDLKYSWQIKNAAGQIISSGDSSTYILPEQDHYLLIPFQAPPVAASISFALESATDNFERDNIRLKSFEAFNVRGEITDQGYTVSGEIINRSAYVLKNLDLAVLLRAPNGAYRGALFTQLNDIRPQEIRPFSLDWPTVLPADTVIDIRPSVNTFSAGSLDLP